MYISTGVKYLHSATINCLIPAYIFKAMAHWYVKLLAIKVRKVGKFYLLTGPIFTGPVTFALLTFFSLLILKSVCFSLSYTIMVTITFRLERITQFSGRKFNSGLFPVECF